MKQRNNFNTNIKYSYAKIKMEKYIFDDFVRRTKKHQRKKRSEKKIKTRKIIHYKFVIDFNE